jgi:WD40 repeat protein
VTPIDPHGAPTVFAIPGHDLGWTTLSPDEDTLVSGGAGEELLAWPFEGAAKPIVLRGHSEMVIGAQFDETGDRLVSASGDGTARVWELATGKVVDVLTGSPQFLADASFDPLGEVVVTIGGDGAVRLWDPVSSKLIFHFGAHTAFGRMVLAAGDRMVSVSWDGEIAIWRIPVEDGSASELERLVACRSPLALDDATGGLVPAPARPDCASLSR